MHKLLLFLLAIWFYPTLGQDSNYLSEMIIKWDNAKKYTLEIADLMPDSSYTFAPVKEEMSFANQLAHIGGNMVWLSSKYLIAGQDVPPEMVFKEIPKQQIITQLTIAFDFAMATLRKLRADNLEEQVDFFAGTMTKRQIVNLLNDHLTHHNSQCLVYLRLNGIKPPKYIGW